jgi:undecaprenyl-diphosphatase
VSGDLQGAGAAIQTLAALIVVAMPLSLLAAGTSVLPGDVGLTQIVQQDMPGWLSPLFAAANLLGKAPFMLAIALALAAGLLLGGHRTPAVIVAMTSLAQGANALLKLLFASPRPEESLVRVSEHANGFGFPSGHVMGTTVLAGALIYVVGSLVPDRVLRRALQSGLVCAPLVMGVARVDAGAHWPSDVLGAWLWGAAATLAIVLVAARRSLLWWPFQANELVASRIAAPQSQSVGGD